MDLSSLDEEIESILFIAREISGESLTYLFKNKNLSGYSVFKVPPLRSNEGYRATEWGDLAQPMWKGRMRIVETSKGVIIRLEDGQTGEAFALTPYDALKPSVEAVLDSSRYFVLRVEDITLGKKAYVGLGFTERSESFDFNVALQDYTKRFKAAQNPPSPTSSTSSPHLPPGPKKDYSLKEGETFSINLNLGSKKNTGGALGSSLSFSGSSGGVPLLPPPPSAPKRK